MQSAPLRLAFWRAKADGVRFELTVPYDTPVFKTGALDHSATHPFVLPVVPCFCTSRHSMGYNMNMPNDGTLTHTTLLWSGYEHEHIEREDEWYWGLGIIAISLALVSVIFGDALFALVIIMAAVTLALISRHPPALTEFELSEKGVRVAHRLHRYREIVRFWVDDEDPAHPVLLLHTNKPLTAMISIPITEVDPKAVRAYLKEHVEEVMIQEPIAHRILEFFGL